MERYPAVKKLLKLELDQLKKRQSMSIQDVAAALHVKYATVAAWRAGQKRPTGNTLRLLSELLYPEDEAKRAHFIGEVDKVSNTSSGRGFLADIANGSTVPNVLMGEPRMVAKFMGNVYERLATFGGWPPKFVDPGDEDSGSIISRGRADIGLGLATDIRSALLLRVVPTPIRIGMNAVALQRHLEEADTDVDAVREELTLGKRTRKLVLPVIRSHDVAGQFVLRTLGFPETSVVAVNRSKTITEFAGELIVRNADSAGVPLAVLDEISCIELAATLRKFGHSPTLIYPLTTRESVRTVKRDVPLFVMGFAIRRNNADLFQYLQDALTFLLQTEIETISDFYEEIRIDMERLAMMHLPRAGQSNPNPKREAREWTRYALRLSDELIDVYEDFHLPWKTVLERAQVKMEQDIRRKVKEAISDVLITDLSQITDQARAAVKVRLQNDFNIVFREEDANFRTFGEVEQTVRRELALRSDRQD